jgi:hypothetical protein
MQTITLDFLDDNALNLLKNLEAMNVIRLHDVKENRRTHSKDAIKSYAGLMTKQPLDEIAQQLRDFRS